MNITDLSQYSNRLDLIKAAAEQIIKDFDMFGLEVKFSGNPHNAYDELYAQVEPHISRLIQNNYSKFNSILYRIDLSEAQIKKAVQNFPNQQFSAVVSDLIIKRELQKVVIRNQYKSSQSSGE